VKGFAVLDDAHGWFPTRHARRDCFGVGAAFDAFTGPRAARILTKRASMQRVRKSVLVPYGAERMFALVDDIERYPEFLPWCPGATVLDRRPDGKTARIDINYHGVRAHFTTDNANVPFESIVVTLVDGPFRHLHGEWRFHPLAPDACRIDFELAYEFATHLLERVVGPVFTRIANTFIDAFVRRAEALHHAPANRPG
jgi:ribosome-associated toxin RatA of RatAB toxin-antitoxin module